MRTSAEPLDIAGQSSDAPEIAAAILLVGWGNLVHEMNLRSPLHKTEVTADHEHFKRIRQGSRPTP